MTPADKRRIRTGKSILDRTKKEEKREKRRNSVCFRNIRYRHHIRKIRFHTKIASSRGHSYLSLEEDPQQTIFICIGYGILVLFAIICGLASSHTIRNDGTDPVICVAISGIAILIVGVAVARWCVLQRTSPIGKERWVVHVPYWLMNNSQQMLEELRQDGYTVKAFSNKINVEWMSERDKEGISRMTQTEELNAYNAGVDVDDILA